MVPIQPINVMTFKAHLVKPRTALLGLLVWKVAFGREEGAADELARGKEVTAPAFTLDRLDTDGRLAIDDLKGKAVVVNFWASWCIPCRDEAPVLQKTFERYRDRGLVVLGVDVNDFRQDARRFMDRYGVTYPVVTHELPPVVRRARNAAPLVAGRRLTNSIRYSS